jgi:hypothetical protein
MAVYFYLNQSAQNQACSVCLDDLDGIDVVYHENGSLHPIHEKCIRQWQNFKLTCPVCRIDVQKLPMSLEEKEVIKVKIISEVTQTIVLDIGFCFLTCANLCFSQVLFSPTYDRPIYQRLEFWGFTVSFISFIAAVSAAGVKIASIDDIQMYEQVLKTSKKIVLTVIKNGLIGFSAGVVLGAGLNGIFGSNENLASSILGFACLIGFLKTALCSRPSVDHLE